MHAIEAVCLPPYDHMLALAKEWFQGCSSFFGSCDITVCVLQVVGHLLMLQDLHHNSIGTKLILKLNKYFFTMQKDVILTFNPTNCLQYLSVIMRWKLDNSNHILQAVTIILFPPPCRQFTIEECGGRLTHCKLNFRTRKR